MFKYLLMLIFPFYGWASEFSPILIEKEVVLKFDQVQIQDGSGNHCQSSEGIPLINPVRPYNISIVSTRSLLNSHQVDQGGMPLFVRSLKVEFEKGADTIGYEVHNRMMNQLDKLDETYDFTGITPFTSQDRIGKNENNRLVLITTHGNLFLNTLKKIGIKSDSLDLKDLEQMAKSIDDPSDYDSYDTTVFH